MSLKKNFPFPVVTLLFCATSAALSVVTLVHTPLDPTWRALHSSDAFRSVDFWLLVLPATLLHSSWYHFLPNLAVGLLLAVAVERRTGPLWLAGFVLLCSVVPTGVELWLSGRPKIGISGVDYALLGFLLPNPPPIRRGLWLAFAVILLGWLAAGILFPISPANPPGNVSHLTGLVLGLTAGFSYRIRRNGRGSAPNPAIWPPH
jgi:membrane associated rhomboid family serine protease